MWLGIREFVLERLAPATGRTELADDEDLIDSGVLDSLGIFQLVAFLEERSAWPSRTPRSRRRTSPPSSGSNSSSPRGPAEPCGSWWR